MFVITLRNRRILFHMYTFTYSFYVICQSAGSLKFPSNQALPQTIEENQPTVQSLTLYLYGALTQTFEENQPTVQSLTL